ncbi:MAG TPA: hypothetical protein VHC97_00105 [Thermoanaerobaculia bacterium]|jgi:hypothetical protein|nr:hypothetical protein [Thermoanaerobaculia bacterium]
MNTVRLSILSALVLALSIASGAWAVDEGQTKPRLSTQSVGTNTTVDLIPVTSGSGNIKGFQCTTTAPLTARLHFYVDGATAQTIDPGLVLIYSSADGALSSAVIPMNIRFQSSIRVALQKNSLSAGSIWCVVSWGLD